MTYEDDEPQEFTSEQLAALDRARWSALAIAAVLIGACVFGAAL